MSALNVFNTLNAQETLDISLRLAAHVFGYCRRYIENLS